MLFDQLGFIVDNPPTLRIPHLRYAFRALSVTQHTSHTNQFPLPMSAGFFVYRP